MVGTSNLGSWNGHWIFQWSSTTQLIFTLLIWTRDLTWPDRKKNLGLQSPGLPRERSLGRWSPGNFFTPHFFMIRFHEFMKEQSSLLVGWWWLMVSDMWFFRHIWDKDVSCRSYAWHGLESAITSSLPNQQSVLRHGFVQTILMGNMTIIGIPTSNLRRRWLPSVVASCSPGALGPGVGLGEAQ